MKRIKMMGLAVVALIAFSAMAATAAQAAPMYQECSKVAKGTGNFALKNCAGSGVAKSGEYELLPVTKKTFTGKAGVSTLDSYIPSNEATPWTGGTVVGTVTCKSAKVTGEITGLSLNKSVAEFKTCTSEGKKCASAGEKAGTIKTFGLMGTLIWLDAGQTKPGVLITGEGPGGITAAFNCEGLEVVTLGEEAQGPTAGVIAEVTGDLTEATKTSFDNFAVNGSGGQDWTGQEGKEGEHFLVSFITPPGIGLPSGENTKDEIKGKSAVRVLG